MLVRVATAIVVAQPGYTDAYYFTDVAARLARGLGLSADFLWSPIEGGRDPMSLALPVASHLFWVPLPTVLGSIGIAAFAPLIGTFRAAQLPIIATAAVLPAITFVAARQLGADERHALVASVVAGLGGLFAPGFVSVDAFAPAAVLGAAFFLAYRRAATGGVLAGAGAGLIVGALYLTRSEAALFGLALLALIAVRRTRRAGVAGSVVALLMGGTWFARDLLAGVPPDLFARSALLLRYEDFFAYVPAYIGTAAASPTDVIGPKLAALVANAGTFAFAYGLLLLVPLAAGVRGLRARADVRAWSALVVLVYLVESLVWTLHSTRGSYFHSVAAFFPFGIAIAAVGAQRMLAGRAHQMSRGWLSGAVVLVAVISYAAVTQWDAAFNGGARTRIAALDAIPAGPFLAIDAAAWRWISDRTVVVTPADGLNSAACVASRAKARAIVLEAAHFSRYDGLYRGAPVSWLDAPIVRGNIRIFPIRGEPPCP